MYSQYIVLFAILFTGYFLRKIDFIDGAMNNGLNRFIVYFAYPCMIVLNLGRLNLNRKLMFNFLLMLGLSLLLFAIHSIWMYFFCRIRKVAVEDAPIVELSSICPNDGFMGFPFAKLFFGAEGFFLMLAHNAAMNFYFFSYGIYALRRNKKEQRKNNPKAITKAFLKLILNPNIIALMIGFAIGVSGITIVKPIEEYLSLIGNIATPMAMIFIGSTLAECDFLEMIKDRVVIEATINKLIFIPMIALVCVMFLPIAPIIKASLVLSCCFPAAATVSMVAQQEGENQQMASKILFMSTIFSIISIPLSVTAIHFFLM